jgi:hypothetical protein
MLYGRHDGLSKFANREELTRSFLFDVNAQIIVSGVDVDRSLERYWRVARAADFVSHLARLKPALVTVPNFSLFVDVPREDNLHNMKRIAICWYELANAGIPAAIHLNGRTDMDWDRWIEFLITHREIDAIAVEFATGLRNPDRGRWHVEQLERMRREVGRDLHLVIRGERFADRLNRSFSRLTIIDTSLYMKSMKRQKLTHVSQSQRRWQRTMTLFEQPLDDLLQSNVDFAAVVRG